jgi:hypothetical protein
MLRMRHGQRGYKCSSRTNDLGAWQQTFFIPFARFHYSILQKHTFSR